MTRPTVCGSWGRMPLLAVALLSAVTILRTARAEAQQGSPAPAESQEQSAESVTPPSPRPAAQVDRAEAPPSTDSVAPPDESMELAEAASHDEPNEPTDFSVARAAPVAPATLDSGLSLDDPSIDDGGSCIGGSACGPGHVCYRYRCVPSRRQHYGHFVALGHVVLGPLGSGIAHFSHGQYAKGFASTAGGVGSFFLGGVIACKEVDSCSRNEFLAGALLGYIAFAVVDIVALATREVPDVQRMAKPVIVPSSKGVVGGLRAEF